jgi:hypothetical protein
MVSHRVVGTVVAHLLDLPPQPGHVDAAFLPPALQVVRVGGDRARLLPLAPLALGETAGVQPADDRALAQADLSGYVLDVEAEFPQFHHLLVALQAFFTLFRFGTMTPARMAGFPRWCSSCWSGNRLGGVIGLSNPSEDVPVSLDSPLHGVVEVLEYVEAVSDLHRPGGSGGCALYVGSLAVTSDHLDAGIRAKPIGERIGRAVRQQVYGFMPLQVHDDRDVCLIRNPAEEFLEHHAAWSHQW